jgi:6-phosphofructokinase 1
LRPLDIPALDEAARRGGTWLGTSRSKEFPTPEGRKKALQLLAAEKVRGLVVIGGNGSITGARSVAGADVAGHPLAVAAIPASIDNDLAATAMSIGADTAMNTIVEACDRINDTANAHHRTFIIQVMGRDCGWLAMTAGIAVGADVVLVPEVGHQDEHLVDKVVRAIEAAYSGGKKERVMVVKAEGVPMDPSALKDAVDARISERLPLVDTRVTVLGHVVRGGAPSGFDRLLGARFGHAAVRALLDGESGFMTGHVGPGVLRPPCKYDPYIVLTPIDEVLAETARLQRGESDLAKWRKKTFAGIDEILISSG